MDMKIERLRPSYDIEDSNTQQAELEQVARALRHELTQQDRDWDCCLSNEQASVELIVKALAAQRAKALEAAAQEARRRDRGAHKELYWLAEWLTAQAQEQRP